MSLVVAGCAVNPLTDVSDPETTVDVRATDTASDVFDVRDATADRVDDTRADMSLDRALPDVLAFDGSVDGDAGFPDTAPDDVVSLDEGPPLDVAVVCPTPGRDSGSGGTLSLATDVQPILTRYCSECHASGMMNPVLLPGESYRALVCATLSVPCPITRFGVVPGEPERSGMYLRVAGAGCYDRMPLMRPPLSATDIDLIRRWILEGAAP